MKYIIYFSLDPSLHDANGYYAQQGFEEWSSVRRPISRTKIEGFLEGFGRYSTKRAQIPGPAFQMQQKPYMQPAYRTEFK